MENYSYEEKKAILELVAMADTGDAMDIEDFFAEIQEERSREEYKQGLKLKLKHWLKRTTKRFVRA